MLLQRATPTRGMDCVSFATNITQSSFANPLPNYPTNTTQPVLETNQQATSSKSSKTHYSTRQTILRFIIYNLLTIMIF